MRLIFIKILALCALVASCKDQNATDSGVMSSEVVSMDPSQGLDAAEGIDWNRLRLESSLIALIKKEKLLDELTKVTDAVVKELDVPRKCEMRNVKLTRTENVIRHSGLELTIYGKGDFAACGRPLEPFNHDKMAVTPKINLGFHIVIAYDLHIKNWILEAEATDTRVIADNDFVNLIKAIANKDSGKPINDKINDALADITGQSIKTYLFHALGVQEPPGTLMPNLEVDETGIRIAVKHSKTN